MNELLELLMMLEAQAQAQAIVDSVNNGSEIAATLTKYKYGTELTNEEAQAKWDSWCIFGKANAVKLYSELQAHGTLADVAKAA